MLKLKDRRRLRRRETQRSETENETSQWEQIQGSSSTRPVPSGKRLGGAHLGPWTCPQCPPPPPHPWREKEEGAGRQWGGGLAGTSERGRSSGWGRGLCQEVLGCPWCASDHQEVGGE